MNSSNMSRKTLLLVVSAASLALAVNTGCRPKKKPTPPPQTVETPTMEMAERMTALQRQAQGLSSVVRQLPGRDAKQDRELVAQAFDATSESLKMMGGREPGGALGQQIDIVDRTRDFLRRGDPKVSIEPSIGAGLRATYGALDGVRQAYFTHEPRVAQLVNVFGGKLPELEEVRGPMHSVVVAEVFQSASDAIGAMSDILSAREQQIAQPAYPTAPQYAQPAAAAAPNAAPAAAPVAPAPAPASTPPQAAPAAASPAPAPAPAPAAAAAPSGPSAEEYQRLQRDYQQLQQQLQQQQQLLQQLQQQQQMQQQLLQRSAPPAPPPAPAPVAPAPANQNK